MRSADLSQSTAPCVGSAPHLSGEVALPAPDVRLDITAESCPMTYVRTRLQLDRMKSGQIIEILLRGNDAVTNVPRTAIEQGHSVVSQVNRADGTTVLRLRKA